MRVIRLLRIVRLLRVIRYIRRIKLLKDAINSVSEPFLIIAMLVLWVSLLTATAVFYSEQQLIIYNEFGEVAETFKIATFP